MYVADGVKNVVRVNKQNKIVKIYLRKKCLKIYVSCLFYFHLELGTWNRLRRLQNAMEKSERCAYFTLSAYV
jgi:hypothetical protein